MRNALTSLAKAEQVGILLDRRIDPGQRVQWNSSGASLAATLQALALHVGGAASFVHPTCAYVGPPEAAGKLRTLIHLKGEELRRLPPGVSRRWRRPRDWTWPDLAEPRQLLAEEAQRLGVRLPPEDILPHDLWGASTLPRVDGVERLSLLLVQFDRTFSLTDQGRAIEVQPLPERVAIERDYPLPTGDPATTLNAWRQRVPQSKVDIAADRLRVRGTLEEHELLSGRAAAPSAEPEVTPSTEPASEQRYTLSLKQVPLNKLLDTLAERLEIQWDYDRQRLSDQGVRWDQPLSLEVRDRSLDELLEALLEPVGLSYVRDGRRIELLPRHPPGE